MVTTTKIHELQEQRDALADERSTVAEKANDDPYDAAGREAARRMAELDKDLSAADGKFWAAINGLTDAELLTYRDEQALVVADVTATIPSLRARAESDPAHRPQLAAAYRKVRGDLMSLLDKALAARRQARGVAVAREWTAASGALYQQFLVAEATELEPIAALAVSREAAARDGAAVASLPLLPQASVARLREFAALVSSLRRWGVPIDTKSLPASVKTYLEVK